MFIYSCNYHSALIFTENKDDAMGDFPGGPVVKNPPSIAGDVHSIPGQGAKIPQATGQLSPRATTTELACRNYRAHTLWSLRHNVREARVPQQRSQVPQCVLPGHKWTLQKGPDGGPLKRVPSEEAPGRARQPAPRVDGQKRVLKGVRDPTRAGEGPALGVTPRT